MFVYIGTYTLKVTKKNLIKICYYEIYVFYKLKFVTTQNSVYICFLSTYDPFFSFCCLVVVSGSRNIATVSSPVGVDKISRLAE